MNYLDRYAPHIRARRPFTSVQLKGYRTPGGTYILASTPTVNDDDQQHDLMAILADGSVVKLRFNAYIDDVVEIMRGEAGG